MSGSGEYVIIPAFYFRTKNVFGNVVADGDDLALVNNNHLFSLTVKFKTFVSVGDFVCLIYDVIISFGVVEAGHLSRARQEQVEQEGDIYFTAPCKEAHLIIACLAVGPEGSPLSLIRNNSYAQGLLEALLEQSHLVVGTCGSAAHA